MTEGLGKLNVLKCQTGPYLSDHCSIMTQVAMERIDIEKQPITYRKVNKIDTDCMSDEIKSDLEGLQHLDLSKMVRNLNSILANSLDKHSPEKTKTILTERRTLGLQTVFGISRDHSIKWKDHSENLEKTISGQHLKYNVTSTMMP